MELVQTFQDLTGSGKIQDGGGETLPIIYTLISQLDYMRMGDISVSIIVFRTEITLYLGPYVIIVSTKFSMWH